MTIDRAQQWLKTLALHSGAVALLVVSAGYLADHAKAVHDASEVSLPLVAELPVMERRLATLTEQVEMAELQAALRQGSQAEQVNVHILPEDPDFDRLIALFDVFRDVEEAEGVVAHMSAIDIGDPVTQDNVRVRPLHLSFSAHDDGLKNFLSFVRLAGLLTVGDALSADERMLLIQRTEEENPTGIVALEQFFSTNLFDYAQDYRSYEEQVLRSFSSPTFHSAFRSITQSSLLKEARLLFDTNVGLVLHQHDLWPFPFFVIDTIHVERGASPKWQQVSVQLLLYTKL